MCSQDTEGNQTKQQKSKRCKKDTRETSDSQLENSCVVKESNLDDAVGTVTLKKKRKRKHSSSEQDDVSEWYIPKTPEEASSLPEADHLEEVGGSCEITTKKEEEVVAKVLSNEQVKAKEASVGRPDFASDLKESQEYIFASTSQAPPKPQDGVFLQNRIGEKLSILDSSARLSSPTAQKKLCKHKKQPSISSPTGNSDATKDGLLVTGTVEADGNHNNSQLYHMQQKSPVCGHTDGTASSSSNDPISEPLILDKGFLKSPDFPMQNRQTIIQELEEFIPHVRTLSDSSVKQLALRDLPRFKHFKKQGISVRFGRFSKQENELLRKNMEAFLEESGISSAEKLLFSDRFPEEHAHLTRLKRDSLFGLKIAQGIPRPWRLVYYRAKKMFDPRNYNGKYSKKETENLKKYQSLHGNEWKKMSELMNRSSHSLHLKYDEMKSKFNSGAWSKEEIKKLLDTLKEILWAKVKGLDSTQKPKNTDQAMLLRENLYKGIPWFQVEAKVGTRRWKQCKRKWLYIVTRKMSHGMMKNHGLENLKFKINFIERLYELDVEDIEDVDWDDLSRIIGNVPPDYVRNRFYKIKSMYVPQWRKKTFSEIIDYLHKNILPNLRSKVAGTETKEVATEGGGLKTVFKFNEIFQDDDDLIDDDEDEEEGRNH
ncbi:transcription termination factor 1-like isoform X2 [Sceloporus undulatus]|uniref:transcription termination factor 1-like isoform X2 n=1 Tax=Sceloporus undulatus TaxID=8520 RepID=UPI001C4B4974|nr:transcription termination factor 1-like isoform X2 [Sceloporus undulatus]